MRSLDREAAPLLAKKQEHAKEVRERRFVRAFIGGMVLMEVVEIVLVILKHAKVISWPWMVTLAPLWVMFGMYAVAAAILALTDKSKK